MKEIGKVLTVGEPGGWVPWYNYTILSTFMYLKISIIKVLKKLKKK